MVFQNKRRSILDLLLAEKTMLHWLAILLPRANSRSPVPFLRRWIFFPACNHEMIYGWLAGVDSQLKFLQSKTLGKVH